MDLLIALLQNPTFWSGFMGWFAAQATKLLIDFIKTKRVNLYYLVSTGGMPSAHSSMISAITTSVALREGTGNSLFAITLAVALIIMFDSQSVRRAAGLQARILNQMIEEFFRNHRFSESKLVELLGHTPLEVFMGMIMGVLCAIFVHAFVSIE